MCSTFYICLIISAHPDCCAPALQELSGQNVGEGPGQDYICHTGGVLEQRGNLLVPESGDAAADTGD